MRAPILVCFLSLCSAAAGFRAPPVPRMPTNALAGPARSPAVRLDFGGGRFQTKADAEDGEVAEVPFEVRFSLGNVISGSGAVLFAFCIGKFLLNNGESDVVSTFGFVYAIPALVGGLALKYAELPPVNLDTTPAAVSTREKKATKIQAKILSDATRFTYGDAHMEDPLKALKLAPRGMGPPELVNLAEFVTPEGEYALTMRFFAPNTPYRVWKDRAPRLARFFGPGVRATLKKYDATKRLVEMALITTAEVRDHARGPARSRISDVFGPAGLGCWLAAAPICSRALPRTLPHTPVRSRAAAFSYSPRSPHTRHAGDHRGRRGMPTARADPAPWTLST